MYHTFDENNTSFFLRLNRVLNKKTDIVSRMTYP